MVSRAKKLPSALLTLGVLLAIALFLIFPARYAESVKTGISLWAISVLPATLPMLFLTAIFTKRSLFTRFSNLIAPASGKLFRVSGAGACAALLSAISGYPVGARTVYDLATRGALDEEERLRVTALSTTTGPAFLVGAVGSGMFHSVAIGWLLYLSHLLGVYLICFFLRFSAKKHRKRIPVTFTDTISLSEILSNSVLSVLYVGGAIAVFYAFGEMLADIGALLALPASVQTLLHGILEMTSGCALLAGSASPLSLAICCFFVTFGGLCVLVQQLAFLAPTMISVSAFIGIKFLQGLAAGLICFLLALLL